MLNMIKMDLYRMFHMKSFYIVWMVRGGRDPFYNLYVPAGCGNLQGHDTGRAFCLSRRRGKQYRRGRIR